jgi:hypothetical protein
MLARPVVKCAVRTAFLFSACTSLAQQTQIPFQQIQREAQLSAMRATFNPDPGGGVLSGSTLGVSSSATPSLLSVPASVSSSVVSTLVPVRHSRDVVDAKFILLNGQQLVVALADVAISQRCIDGHQCAEANPFMPSSLAAKLSLDLGISAYATSTSYYLKKHGSKWWWFPPVSGIAIHTVGLTSGLAH